MASEALLSDDWNRLYIDGDWIDAGDRDSISVTDPSTGDEFTRVPSGTAEDVDRAFEAAGRAQADWADRLPHERAGLVRDVIDVFHGYQEEVVELLKVESGSVQYKAADEFVFTAGVLEESSSHSYRPEGDVKQSMIPGKDNVVRRVPVGTVGVITPWNFPLVLTMRAVAPAVALGNAVVLKPAGETPVTGGLLVAKLFDEAGAPDGLVNVVTGPGSVVGDAVAGHPDAAVVSFTGSTEVGRDVGRQAVTNLNFPSLELGGNNPYVVTENADLDRAVMGGVFASYNHQGQSCIAINRHLVHEAVYDEYRDRLVERTEELNVGPTSDPDNVVGPIINEAQRDQVVQYIEETIDQGATLETGGGHDGLFVEPTVLSGVTNDMAVACNEAFGPIAPLIPYGTDEEAIELANDTEYGLTAAVQSMDINQAWTIANGIDAGMVHINDHCNVDDPQSPFGGMKNSGIGRYNGAAIIEKFTEPKWISVQGAPHEAPF